MSSQEGAEDPIAASATQGESDDRGESVGQGESVVRLEAGQVRAMFDRVAGFYDLLNTVMSAGLHHRWRERAADLVGASPGDRVLDVATGTGDLAIELARRVSPGGEVVGSDFSENMLGRARIKGAKAAGGVGANLDGGMGANLEGDARARAKTKKPPRAKRAFFVRAREDLSGNGDRARLSFEWGDALELPYPDNSFDAATVGFGARNFDDLAAGLREMRRVVRPGGRVVVLEFTTPTRPPLSIFYAIWFDRIVPVLGRLAGDPDAYTYLPNSVKRWPGPRELAGEMERAGLCEIRYLLTAGGIVAIHAATVP